MSNIPANSPPEFEFPPTEDTAPAVAVTVDVMWDDSVSHWQQRLGVTDDRIAEAVIAAAKRRGYDRGRIGVRITDDSAIHEVNVRYLSHDYPTDVISFPYSETPDRIEGELVASVETAGQNAADAGWETASELLLYVIHGVLHIGGMDDHGAADRADMRRAERMVLTRLGICVDPMTTEGDQSD